ncbi:MAG: hypothetical protein KY476_21690 [Planctomycetes bacterium]|nr:hypothetical protein [Planctomycetota bacterium]
MIRRNLMPHALAIIGALLAAASAAAGDIHPELTPPVRVEAGGQPIDVGGIGYAAPFYGDFDGDGVSDLLLGEFSQGRMRVFRNYGTDSRPEFKDWAFFKAGDGDGRVPAG